MSRPILRWIATVLVLSCLTAGAAQAWPSAPARPALAAPEVPGVLAAAWDWLTSLLRPAKPEPARQARSNHQKAGCGMDPDGKQKPCY
jgi:hypothetical protein